MRSFIILLVIITNIFSQNLKHIGAPGGYIQSIYINNFDTNILYSAGYPEGSIFISYDKGQTVVPIRHEFGEAPYKVFGSGVGENERIYVDARLEGIYRTDDRGYSWAKIAEDNTEGTVNNPFQVSPIDQNILYVIQNNKDFMYSNSYGQSWKKRHTFDKNIRTMAISKTDTTVIYAAADHAIYKSVNSGNDWQKYNVTFPYDWRPFKIKVNPQNDNSLFLVVSGSLLKMSNWGKLDTLFSGDVNDFDICPNDSAIIYLGWGDPVFYQGGGLVKSTNNGQSWQEIEIELPNRYVGNAISIDPDNLNTVYSAFGKTYGVFRSDDAGKSWTITNLGNATPADFLVLNDKPGTILSHQYLWNMLKTDNWGQNWNYPQFSPPITYWGDFFYTALSINPENSNIAYYAGKSDLYKTEDGGDTWLGAGKLKYPALVEYHSFNDQVIWTLLDSSYDEYLSEDGGESWERIYSGEDGIPVTAPGQRTFNKKEPELIYAVGVKDFDSYILKSRDNFRSWDEYNDGLPRHPETHLVYNIRDLKVNPVNPSILYAALRDYGLMRSNDSGYTWVKIDSSLSQLTRTERINDILLDENDTTKIYVSIDRHGQPLTEKFVIGGLYVTTNSAKSWKEVYRGETDKIRRDNAIPPNIYFSTPYGIWMINDSVATDIKPINKNMPDVLTLSQNYPNPFNPQTTIDYSINRPGRVTLKVYDITGKLVSTLVDKHQTAGNYKIIFNGHRIASGIYIYRLVQQNQTLQNKMLLLK